MDRLDEPQTDKQMSATNTSVRIPIVFHFHGNSHSKLCLLPNALGERIIRKHILTHGSVNHRENSQMRPLSILFPILLLGQSLVVIGHTSIPVNSKGNSVATAEANAARSTTAGPSSRPAAVSQQAKSQVMQTQDYNFRISTHEITTATSYLYVTPAGNYSFSKFHPWNMSYVSLWENTTSFSGYGIQESGDFLLPSDSVIEAAQTSFAVSTTQLSGISTHGDLYCFYDFSKTPELTSCEYTEIKGIAADFSIAWITTGDYLSTDGKTTEKAATQAGLSSLGNHSSIMLGETSDASKWHQPLYADWRDFGSTSVMYGKLTFAAATWYGVVVAFPQGVNSIDPSLVQKKTCAANNGQGGWVSYTCSFSSNVTSGDLLVVGQGDASENVSSFTISDTRGDSWSLAVQASQTNSGMYSYIWSAMASSSGSNTVTLSHTSSQIGSGIAQSYLYEVSGVSGNVVEATATGQGRNICGYNCAQRHYATNSSNSFSSYDFAVGVFTAYNYAIGGAYESGYSYYQGGLGTSNSIYSTSGVSSPTSYTIVDYGPSGGCPCQIQWAQAGALFSTAKQPITATPGSGVSQGTAYVSGCSVSPTQFAGDGSLSYLIASGGCTLTLTSPSNTVWQGTGTTTTHLMCASGQCPVAG